MKKSHIIFFVLLGFLLTPTAGFACGKNSNHSCKKEISNTAKRDCCSGHDHSGNSEGCGGKCGHKSCGCASGCITVAALLQPIEFAGFTHPSYFFKANFYHPGNRISSGFDFVWLIPKIS